VTSRLLRRGDFLLQHISVAQFDFELQRPRTSAEVLNDCEEEIDAEVSELIRRNGEELRQLRHSLKAAKKEMNQMENRKRESRSSRPLKDGALPLQVRPCLSRVVRHRQAIGSVYLPLQCHSLILRIGRPSLNRLHFLKKPMRGLAARSHFHQA